MTPPRRVLAVGGLVGPAAFVAAWSVLGATRPGYSPVDDAISQLAASGTSTRVGMSAGFGVFGAGMTLYAVALRDALPGPAWTMAVATGVATMGVAALPLGTSLGETPHAAAAAVGYASLAALPLLASRPLARRGRRRGAAYSVVTGVVSGACVLASFLGPAPGLFQRAGLTVVDVWVVGSAVQILRQAQGYGPGPEGRARTRPVMRRSR